MAAFDQPTKPLTAWLLLWRERAAVFARLGAGCGGR